MHLTVSDSDTADFSITATTLLTLDGHLFTMSYHQATLQCAIILTRDGITIIQRITT